jgi:hypothetical protein
LKNGGNWVFYVSSQPTAIFRKRPADFVISDIEPKEKEESK